ncbi:MAG: hypothetical protein QJR07_19105 [Acetobacteraceae bacterium]|nr:hypothetical protein [Acetobacteraceae bacterium]
MPVADGATIIPFPRPRQDGMQRLNQVLCTLNAACAGQREAVASFRRNLAGLKASMEQLDRTVRRYRDRLDSLGGEFGSLGAESRRLEKWAAAMTERPFS